MPDFRNLGVIMRVLLLGNAAALAAALVRSQRAGEIATQFIQVAFWTEPVLIASLAALYIAAPALGGLGYAAGAGCTLALVALLSAALFSAQAIFGNPPDWTAYPWNLAYALALAGLLLGYFRLRSRAFSPAIAEARLQALQARIRPHFLFNSLNAVLALIRREPKKAEGALEDLAELFRNLLADERKLIPLRDEIALCRQYLNLEHLRLGERLRVRWDVEPRAEDALVPPMLLQPLVENAVYHGIEPGLGAGAIEIRIGLDREGLRLTLSNPYHPEHQHRAGNRMALGNIRERLALHFDVEASLAAAADGERYRIEIVIPYRRHR